MYIFLGSVVKGHILHLYLTEDGSWTSLVILLICPQIWSSYHAYLLGDFVRI